MIAGLNPHYGHDDFPCKFLLSLSLELIEWLARLDPRPGQYRAILERFCWFSVQINAHVADAQLQ